MFACARRYAQLPAVAQQAQGEWVPLAASLSTRFVRLVGLLFDRINLETFGAVFGDAFASLQVGDATRARLERPTS